MSRNLVVLGDKSSVETALEKKFGVASEFTPATSPRTTQVDSDNVLFIDASSFGESDVPNNEYVVAALERGIPIVISEPSADLLGTLTGLGVQDVKAAIIVKGKGRFFYSQTLRGSESVTVESFHSSKKVPLEGKQGENEEKEEKDNQGDSSVKEVPPPTIVEIDIPKAVIEIFDGIEQVESSLQGIAESSWQNNSLPDNRKWSLFWDPGDWKKFVQQDPSEQTSKTQTMGSYCTITYQLLAANEPVPVKVFTATPGGAGFQPKVDGDTMIRNDDQHRGWVQCQTFMRFEPRQDDAEALGAVQDYVPVNTANQVEVTAGHSWDIGFTAGGGPDGPEGSVSFSFQKDSSHTKQTTDFRTLTDVIDRNSIIFYHNVNVVGGNTEVDALKLVDYYWNDEKEKMFYTSGGKWRVRSWPSLSMELLRPDCECIWYTQRDETRRILFRSQATQGIAYYYITTSGIWAYFHSASTFISKIESVSIHMDSVDYNDPE